LRKFIQRRGQDYLRADQTNKLELFFQAASSQLGVQNQFYKEKGILDDRSD
jgi:hypothetical protein